MINIRPIAPEDNEAVKHLIKTVLGSFGANKPGFASQDPEIEDMFNNYDRLGYAYWVVEIDGVVKGGGGIAPLKGEDLNWCELQKMYFLPELRGKGMGRELLKICLDFASKIYKYCYLETLDSMKTAKHLYDNYGFDFLEIPMGETGHTGCNVWMKKKLHDSKLL